MHSIITPTKSTFSAPVVQSRLEHHHLLQQKTGSKQPVKPEVKQHQRSKSRGKRHITPQKESSTAIATLNTPAITILSRPPSSSNKNSSSNSHRGDNFDVNDNDRTNLVDHSGAALIEESTSSSSSLHLSKKNCTTSGVSNGSSVRRGHQYSDSVGEMTHRDMPVITILKRPKSATDFVKTHQPALSNGEEEEVDHYRQNRSPFKSERLPPNQNSRNGERRRSDTQSPKVRRTQRRKDIKPTTGSVVDTDLLFGISPPQPSPLQDSSDESDVNSIINTYIKRVPSPSSSSPPPQSNNAANFPIPTEAKDLESSFNRPLSRDFKRHSDVFLPTQSVAIPNTMRRQSITAIELKSEISTFAQSEEYASFPPSAATVESSSPSKVMASNSKLYAGPTFHNSPAPSDLPLPSFLHSRYIGKEGGDLPMVPEIPTPVISVNGGNRSDDENMFVMEDDLESNSFSFDDHYVRQQQSLEILTLLANNVLAAQQPAVAAHSPSTAAYNVPERMATSHPLHVFPQANLTEISENLRNILKIQGQ